MGDADGGRSLVDVLSAGAAGPVCIDPDILIPDLYIHILLDVRHDIAGYKGSLPLSRGIEGGNADQTVNPHLRAHKPVGILPVDLEGYGLDSRLVTVQIIEKLHGKPFLVDPPGVHAVEHAAPVAGFRPAGARVKGHDRVIAVILPGQEGLDPDRFEIGLEIGQRLLDIRYYGGVILFIPHIDQKLRLLILAAQAAVGRHVILQRTQILHNLLGLFGIVPEGRLRHGPLKLLDPAFLVLKVQGTSHLFQRLFVRLQFCLEFIQFYHRKPLSQAPFLPWHCLYFRPLPHGQGSFG